MKHKSIQKSIFPPTDSIRPVNIFDQDKINFGWDKFNRELYESIRYVKESEKLKD